MNLYFTAKDVKEAYGQAFNIGGGIENSLSLLELFALIEEILDIKMEYKQLLWRENDQKVFIADYAKANRILNWEPLINSTKGLEKILAWTETLR